MHNYNQLFINTTVPAVDWISISTSKIDKNTEKTSGPTGDQTEKMKDFSNYIVNNYKVSRTMVKNSVYSKHSTTDVGGFNVLKSAKKMNNRFTTPKTNKEKKKERKEIEQQKKDRESFELSSDEDSKKNKKNEKTKLQTAKKYLSEKYKNLKQ